MLIIYQQILKLVYELPEDGTDVRKHAAEVKDYIFKRVSNLCIKLVL